MKIYYTTVRLATGWKVTYLDHQGATHEYPGTVEEFDQQFFKSSVFLKSKDFEARKRQAAADRARLAQWKEWAV